VEGESTARADASKNDRKPQRENAADFAGKFLSEYFFIVSRVDSIPHEG